MTSAASVGERRVLLKPTGVRRSSRTETQRRVGLSGRVENREVSGVSMTYRDTERALAAAQPVTVLRAGHSMSRLSSVAAWLPRSPFSVFSPSSNAPLTRHMPNTALPRLFLSSG